MKKVIYKYSLDIRDCPTINTVGRNKPFEISMVKGAVILDVQAQTELRDPGDGNMMPMSTGRIWVLADPEEKEKEQRTFLLMETGVPFEIAEEETAYIGTYQVYGGKIVLHLFEILK